MTWHRPETVGWAIFRQTCAFPIGHVLSERDDLSRRSVDDLFVGVAQSSVDWIGNLVREQDYSPIARFSSA
ncbi:unnamed protein product [Protopolystoma xenopodis]|uniref:Uncharacterized protein n=1 Tax=Protopolystoma xenopodis TaxID=117903 RepID=A0A448X4M4_9PLAT|nr:unnamed protein product [Protopolystoma xenopodis]